MFRAVGAEFPDKILWQGGSIKAGWVLCNTPGVQCQGGGGSPKGWLGSVQYNQQHELESVTEKAPFQSEMSASGGGGGCEPSKSTTAGEGVRLGCPVYALV